MTSTAIPSVNLTSRPCRRTGIFSMKRQRRYPKGSTSGITISPPFCQVRSQRGKDDKARRTTCLEGLHDRQGTPGSRGPCRDQPGGEQRGILLPRGTERLRQEHSPLYYGRVYPPFRREGSCRRPGGQLA